MAIGTATAAAALGKMALLQAGTKAAAAGVEAGRVLLDPNRAARRAEETAAAARLESDDAYSTARQKARQGMLRLALENAGTQFAERGLSGEDLAQQRALTAAELLRADEGAAARLKEADLRTIDAGEEKMAEDVAAIAEPAIGATSDLIQSGITKRYGQTVEGLGALGYGSPEYIEYLAERERQAREQGLAPDDDEEEIDYSVTI